MISIKIALIRSPFWTCLGTFFSIKLTKNSQSGSANADLGKALKTKGA